MALKRHTEFLAPSDTTSANTYHDGVHGNLHHYPNTVSSAKGDLALLYTCREIHSEAYPSFCMHNIFSFHHPIDFANDFLRTLPPTNLASIRHIRCHVPDRHHVQDRWSDGLVKVFKIYRELSNLHCFILETTQDWYYGGRFQKTGAGNEISDQCYGRSLWDQRSASSDARKVALQLLRQRALRGFDVEGKVYILNPDGLNRFLLAGRRSKLVFNIVLTRP